MTTIDEALRDAAHMLNIREAAEDPDGALHEILYYVSQTADEEYRFEDAKRAARGMLRRLLGSGPVIWQRLMVGTQEQRDKVQWPWDDALTTYGLHDLIDEIEYTDDELPAFRLTCKVKAAGKRRRCCWDGIESAEGRNMRRGFMKWAAHIRGRIVKARQTEWEI